MMKIVVVIKSYFLSVAYCDQIFLWSNSDCDQLVWFNWLLVTFKDLVEIWSSKIDHIARGWNFLKLLTNFQHFFITFFRFTFWKITKFDHFDNNWFFIIKLLRRTAWSIHYNLNYFFPLPFHLTLTKYIKKFRFNCKQSNSPIIFKWKWNAILRHLLTCFEIPRMRLGVLPEPWIKGMLPTNGSLRGPGGNFLGFFNRIMINKKSKTQKIEAKRNIFALSLLKILAFAAHLMVV